MTLPKVTAWRTDALHLEGEGTWQMFDELLDEPTEPHRIRIHEVLTGETLTSIARRYYGNEHQSERLFEANRDKLEDPRRLRPGQMLWIPD